MRIVRSKRWKPKKKLRAPQPCSATKKTRKNAANKKVSPLLCDPGRISFRREPPSEEDDDASSPTPRRDSPCASSSLSLSSHLVHACPIPASPRPFTADSPSPVRANVRAPRCAGPSSRPVPAIAGGVFSLRQSPRWSRSPRRGRPRCSLLCTLAQSRNAPWVVLWAGASLVPPPCFAALTAAARGGARVPPFLCLLPISSYPVPVHHPFLFNPAPFAKSGPLLRA